MNCSDCAEPITEIERRNMSFCDECEVMLHGECAMVNSADQELCEECFVKESSEYLWAMGKKPVRWV